MHSSKVINRGYLDNIIVTSKDGKVYNLGKPTSKFFKIKVIFYKLRRKING